MLLAEVLAASADTEAWCSVLLPVGLVQGNSCLAPPLGKECVRKVLVQKDANTIIGMGDKRHRSFNSNWSGIKIENKQRRLSSTSKP